MPNNYTDILKAQRVERRRSESHLSRGNAALKPRQDVVRKRPAGRYRNAAEGVVIHNEVSLRARQADVLDGAAVAAAGFEGQAKKPEAPVSRWTRLKKEERPRADAPVAAQPPAADGGEADARARFDGRPAFRLALVLSACAVLAFFAYNALLWQSGENIIQPPPDGRIRRDLLGFAAGNGTAANEVNGDIHRDNLPVNTSETFGWQYYTVKKGDSVSKIAADHALSMDAVVASNGMKNARSIREGDVLRIPNMDGIPYTAAKGDGYEAVAERFAVPLNAILDANDIMSSELSAGTQLFIPGAKMRAEDLKMALGELFIYPIRGRLSSSFGWRKDPFTGERRYHNAIDLAAETGVPVKATRDGKVTTVAFSPVFGRYVIVSHPGDYQSMYAHLSSTAVSQGAKVGQGDKIGEVGNTGHSTGSHLHFAIYKNGRAVNPLELLKL
ncbi:MAG: M23 family metallopeptidase [Spirochaetaceae bacterium]|nr:M23 family metallopeptidase [Spirochaetaceae bacterium]